MKAVMRWGGGLGAVLLFSSVSFGWNWASPVFKTPFPMAPDACGPGYYVVGPCGMVYGPNYWLQPPCPPFNGMLPGRTGQALQQAQHGIPPWAPPPAGMPNLADFQQPPPPHAPTGIYPTHPYIRGPRDFFMWSEDMEDMRGRDMRPFAVVP
jgi:hypothetical protein